MNFWELDSTDCKVSDVIIGSGKFGKVALAEWFTTPVAVKCLFNFELPENDELFDKEIKLMQQLHHPCIVQFLGYCRFEPQGSIGIVMELLPNGIFIMLTW